MAFVKTILVVGENSGRTKQRVLAMRRLGYNVDIVSHVSEDLKPGINEHISLCDRVWNKLGFPRDHTRLNQRVLEKIKNKSYDVLWVEKALLLKPATLKKIPNAIKKVWCSEDDMFARHNQSYYFKKSLPFYDIVFTTKSYNCDPQELPSLGAKKVIFFSQAYDPTLHCPLTLSAEDREKYAADVGFIGTFEKDRYEKMLFLAKKGIPVRVWGNGWKPCAQAHPNLHIENQPLYETDYVKAIQATKINLCFLRKINRDLHTSRSIEIPACRAFMLAERTNEHQQLFLENKEVAFFDIHDVNELYQKVAYYLAHDDERNGMAENAYLRCKHSGYSHDERLRWMMGIVEQ